MTFKTWLLFLVMETALSLSPGPAVFYVVSQGVRAWPRAFPATLGILTRQCPLLRTFRHEPRRAHRRERALLYDCQMDRCGLSGLSRHQIAAFCRLESFGRSDRHGSHWRRRYPRRGQAGRPTSATIDDSAIYRRSHAATIESQSVVVLSGSAASIHRHAPIGDATNDDPGGHLDASLSLHSARLRLACPSRGARLGKVWGYRQHEPLARLDRRVRSAGLCDAGGEIQPL